MRHSFTIRYRSFYHKYSCEEEPLCFWGSAFSGFFPVYITRKVFAGGFQYLKKKSDFGKKIGFRPYRFLGTLGQLIVFCIQHRDQSAAAF
ncbi:MAG: hypothetical protein DRR19_00605 [Candidatus Parabeggiatoa sp. nov. 1]|nr:MAG: hypothetical protein DRR19_00605 [Gammaproteobacteria bacterium]